MEGVNKKQLNLFSALKLTGPLRRYAANATWLMAARAVLLASGIAVGALVARYLGPERLGMLRYAGSLSALVAPIAGLGLRKIVTRELVPADALQGTILGTSLVLQLVAGIVSLAAVVTISWLLGDSTFIIVLVVVIGLMHLLKAGYVFEDRFNARVEGKYVALTSLAGTMSGHACRLLLIFTAQSLLLFAIVIPFEALVTVAAMIFVYCRHSGRKLYFNHQRARQMLADAWPLLLSGLSVAVYMQMDQVMIKHMMTNEAVGSYAVAVRMVTATYFIPTIITTSIFPAVVKSRDAHPEVYRNRMLRLYGLMSRVSLMLAIPLSFLAMPLILTLFGSAYAPAVSVLQIYAWSIPATCLGLANGQQLIAENLTRTAFARTIVGAIVNVALNVILIPIWGINGAAIATLISYTLATLTVLVVRDTRNQGKMMLLAFLSLGFYRGQRDD